MKKLKIFVGLVLILALILFGINYFADNNQTEDNTENSSEAQEEEIDSERERQPERTLKDATISLYSDDQETKWELSATEIKDYQEPEEYILETINANVYEADDKVLEVSADSGKMDHETGFLVLAGPIKLVSDNRRIEADRLNWNQTKNELTGRGNILITQPGLEVTADNFVSQIDLRRVNLIDDVQLKAEEKGEDDEQL